MDNLKQSAALQSQRAASQVKNHTPIVLTVAGSDSGGGAGIQADIKTISATGSYACTVITALTAQNTLGVTGVLPIEQAFIEQQFAAVFSDIAVDVVKIGMLGDAATIKTVATALKKHPVKHIVLDPVMVATSGDLLLAREAISSLIYELLPLATVITPNIPEALALLGRDPGQSVEDGLQLCRELLELGSQSVLVKGGHLTGATSSDYWLSHSQQQIFSSARIDTKNTHGTGCTLSSAIASYLAQGQDLTSAIGSAKGYISEAIKQADQLQIGSGAGPVHHFYAQPKR
ncbi:MAG: bifunctional hydroxymethylpyrimidine kinase/phosphomethylpyrimidine kinase [Pseudomonadales bacterium]|nr:bifunctional hydroxymethylpyrimidine kinase/phosphomethylpyrimidine kinase [Pseudomonadales bacterium]NRA18238.1 bifunctional hydroxymethylpyrimidine kinase/phosphomethylpyrimidine kinase [Oceanospirillaceae bacterium]